VHVRAGAGLAATAEKAAFVGEWRAAGAGAVGCAAGEEAARGRSDDRIVKPETLVGWHRAIVRRHWRLLSWRKPGRPAEYPQQGRIVCRRVLGGLINDYCRLAA